jgi:hypothetical protein
VPSKEQSERIMDRATSQMKQTAPEYLLASVANVMTGRPAESPDASSRRRRSLVRQRLRFCGRLCRLPASRELCTPGRGGCFLWVGIGSIPSGKVRVKRKLRGRDSNSQPSG